MNKKLIISTVAIIPIVLAAALFAAFWNVSDDISDKVDVWRMYKEIFITTKGFSEGDAGSTEVRGDRKLLMEIENKPGFLISVNPEVLPPTPHAPPHPFLSGKVYDPFEADALGKLLKEAKTFEEFISFLKNNGYIVEKIK